MQKKPTYLYSDWKETIEKESLMWQGVGGGVGSDAPKDLVATVLLCAGKGRAKEGAQPIHPL